MTRIARFTALLMENLAIEADFESRTDPNFLDHTEINWLDHDDTVFYVDIKTEETLGN